MDENRYEELLNTAFHQEAQAPASWTKRAIEKCKDSQKDRGGIPKRRMKTRIIAVVLALTVPACAFAGFRLLSAGDTALLMDDEELAKAFNTKENRVITVEDGEYAISLIGLVSGEDFKKSGCMADEAEQKMFSREEMTYVAIAIQRRDGVPIESFDEADFYMTMLIEGKDPMQWNSATFGNSYRGMLNNGVLYYITECDRIQAFADHKLYVAVIEGVISPGREAINFDDISGNISLNPDYNKAHALFEAEIDPSKADKAVADIVEAEIEKKVGNADEPVTEMKVYETQKGGLFFKMCDGRIFERTEGDVKCSFNFYVCGGGIKSVALRTNKGKLLQAQLISESEYNRIESAQNNKHVGLRKTQGMYLLYDYEKAFRDIDIDYTRLTKNLWGEEAITLIAEPESLEKIQLEITATKDDGSIVSQKVKVCGTKKIEGIEYVMYKFI